MLSFSALPFFVSDLSYIVLVSKIYKLQALKISWLLALHTFQSREKFIRLHWVIVTDLFLLAVANQVVYGGSKMCVVNLDFHLHENWHFCICVFCSLWAFN